MSTNSNYNRYQQNLNVQERSIGRGWIFRQHMQDIKASNKARLNVVKVLLSTSLEP